jgi:hypothetical protein
MKRKFKSDGQQFHQYQQNKQSSLTLTHWTQKKIMTFISKLDLFPFDLNKWYCQYQTKVLWVLQNIGRCDVTLEL